MTKKRPDKLFDDVMRSQIDEIVENEIIKNDPGYQFMLKETERGDREFEEIKKCLQEDPRIKVLLIDGTHMTSQLDMDGIPAPCTDFTFRFNIGNGYVLDISSILKYIENKTVLALIDVCKEVVSLTDDVFIDSCIANNLWGSYGFDLFDFKEEVHRSETIIHLHGFSLDSHGKGTFINKRHGNYNLVFNSAGSCILAGYNFGFRDNTPCLLFTKGETNDEVIKKMDLLEDGMSHLSSLIRDDLDSHIQLKRISEDNITSGNIQCR